MAAQPRCKPGLLSGNSADQHTDHSTSLASWPCSKVDLAGMQTCLLRRRKSMKRKGVGIHLRNSGLQLAGPTRPQNRLTAQPSWGQVNQTLRGHPQTAHVQFSLCFTMQTGIRVQQPQVFLGSEALPAGVPTANVQFSLWFTMQAGFLVQKPTVS